MQELVYSANFGEIERVELDRSGSGAKHSFSDTVLSYADPATAGKLPKTVTLKLKIYLINADKPIVLLFKVNSMTGN